MLGLKLRYSGSMSLQWQFLLLLGFSECVLFRGKRYTKKPHSLSSYKRGKGSQKEEAYCQPSTRCSRDTWEEGKTLSKVTSVQIIPIQKKDLNAFPGEQRLLMTTFQDDFISLRDKGLAKVWIQLKYIRKLKCLLLLVMSIWSSLLSEDI